MSIFGNIMSAIFGRAKSADADRSAQSAAPQTTASAASTASGATESLPRTEAPSSVPQAAPQAPVDVEDVLRRAASVKKETLNWRTSIVDLMKVLDLDSSLAARKELAQELGYTGDMSDSAKMNIWLHRQVMIKLAQNGGKVPEELKA